MIQSRVDLSRYVTNSLVARYGSVLAEKSGLSVTRAANTLRAKRLEALSGLGIEVVLDVGANNGQWASDLRTSGYRGKIISFEPCPEPFARLHDLASRENNHACVQAGLGNSDGDATLLVAQATVQSSFRKPMQTCNPTNAIVVAGQVTVPIRKLDSILPSLSSECDRFYLKIDTQGFEKDVLTGAAETLVRTDAVEIELSLVELYEGQALLPELWQLLLSAGLRPAWLERGYRDHGDIWLLQADGLFIRETSWNARPGR